MLRRLPLTLLLCLALSACAERWSRPGTTEAEAEETNVLCREQAWRSVPVELAWRIVEPSRIERDRYCWRDGNQERCRIVERWRPARWGQVDVNEGARDAWRRSCMVEKGFRFEGYRPLRLN